VRIDKFDFADFSAGVHRIKEFGKPAARVTLVMKLQGSAALIRLRLQLRGYICSLEGRHAAQLVQTSSVSA
tara:strand:- start:4445 stop:4657 length:213 start_codon:yes stop_codon:yes gene_type:complete